MTGGTDMNKKFKVGLIRVLTTEDEEVLQLHGKQIMEYFPELEVVTKCIQDQYCKSCCLHTSRCGTW